MASTLFRSLSSRVIDRKYRRRSAPPTTIAPPVVIVDTAPVEEAVEEVEEPVMYPDGLPLPSTTSSPPHTPATGVSAASAGSPPKPRRRPSIFNRLHSRNVSAESTATTSSSRSTASTLAISLSSSATTLSRSVSTRARAAKRRSVEFMAVPMYEGVLVEDDAISLKDQDGSASHFDIIL